MISALLGPFGVVGAVFAGGFALAFVLVAATRAAPSARFGGSVEDLQRAEASRRRLVLLALAGEELSLDGVITRVQALSWERGLVGTGWLVPTLFGLVREGLIEESGEKVLPGFLQDLPRTHYALTLAGRRQVEL